MQISNRPIAGRALDAFHACRHNQEDLLNSKPSIRMRRKAEFGRGVVVAGLSFSETADLLAFFNTTIALV